MKIRVKYNAILIFLILISFSLISCSNRNNDGSVLIHYSKSKCFGNCEVYDLTIFSNGEVKYNGIKNVEYLGEYYSEISSQKINDIRVLFKNSNFHQLSPTYLNKSVRDLPRLRIQFENKKVEFHKRKAPKNLLELSGSIEQLLTQLSLKKS